MYQNCLTLSGNYVIISVAKTTNVKIDTFTEKELHTYDIRICKSKYKTAERRKTD